MAADDKQPDDPEVLQPDPEPAPPLRAQRSRHQREDEYDDDFDDDDDDDRPRRQVKYDEDGNEITSDHTMWGLFTYLGSLLLGILAPVIIYFVFREKSPYVARHAKLAINYALTHILFAFGWMAVAAAIGFGVYLATQQGVAGLVTGYVVGMIGVVLLSITRLVFLIMATVAASKNEFFRFPVCITFFG